MKIQVNIYEYNGESYSPLKGCVYAAFFTDSQYDIDETKMFLLNMTLNSETLADMFKLQGVKHGKVCVEYKFTENDEYLDGDEFYVKYDGEKVELDWK